MTNGTIRRKIITLPPYYIWSYYKNSIATWFSGDVSICFLVNIIIVVNESHCEVVEFFVILFIHLSKFLNHISIQTFLNPSNLTSFPFSSSFVDSVWRGRFRQISGFTVLLRRLSWWGKVWLSDGSWGWGVEWRWRWRFFFHHDVVLGENGWAF